MELKLRPEDLMRDKGCVMNCDQCSWETTMKCLELTSRTHELKIFPEFYKEVIQNTKSFELRKDDRGFKVGDIVVLKEYDVTESKFTGNFIVKKISYILRDFSGLQKGYCILNLVSPEE